MEGLCSCHTIRGHKLVNVESGPASRLLPSVVIAGLWASGFPCHKWASCGLPLWNICFPHQTGSSLKGRDCVFQFQPLAEGPAKAGCSISTWWVIEWMDKWIKELINKLCIAKEFQEDQMRKKSKGYSSLGASVRWGDANKSHADVSVLYICSFIYSLG